MSRPPPRSLKGNRLHRKRRHKHADEVREQLKPLSDAEHQELRGLLLKASGRL